MLMRPKVKICGITNPDDAQAAVEAGADAIGFVFHQDSPRYVQPDLVRRIVADLPPFVLTVGVFVNADVQTVQETMQQCALAMAQLHGDETIEVCEAIGRPILKALRLRMVADLSQMTTFRSATVRGFLLDAVSPDGYGGTGRRADWGLAAEAAKAAPVILAGGLTPENVGLAIQSVRPSGVDVSSGVEIRPGRKDPALIRRFVRAAHLAWEQAGVYTA